MFVKNVLELVHGIKALATQTFDKAFVEEMETHFSKVDPEQELGRDDVDFLKHTFSNRWLLIMATSLDYTLDPRGINEFYIRLAKTLDPKRYLFILMPTIKNRNDRDPHDSSLLHDTQRLENFVVSYDGTTLYRKRIFCDFLVSRGYELSIRRAFDGPRRPVSVVELARILQSQVNHEFTEGNELFSSVWEFIKKRSFSKLQSQGIPLTCLYQDLNGVLMQYQSTRKQHNGYDAFRKSLNGFLDDILRYEFREVNYFYGETILCNNTKYALVECLVELYQAHGFQHDGLVDAMLRWLHSKCPTLRLDSDNVLRQQPSAPGLLLYFYTFNFSEKKSACLLWDHRNDTPRSTDLLVGTLYSELERNAHLEQNSAYAAILEKFVYPWIKEHHIDETDEWMRPVLKGTFYDKGIYWFEPEVLMHALLYPPQINGLKDDFVEGFLNKMIRTYALPHSDLDKRLRVNIQWTHFLSKHDGSVVKQLLHWIYLNQELLVSRKGYFMKDCQRFISNNVNEIKDMVFDYHPEFLRRRSQELNLKDEHTEVSLGDYIHYALDYIASLDNKSTHYPSITYLTGLLTPILTVKEVELSETFSSIPAYYSGGSNWSV